MLNSKSIGNRIAEARKKINLSQAELAQKVSISAQAVGKWERGESMPDIFTLNRLCEILGVELNYFSEGFQPIGAERTTAEKPGNNLVEFPNAQMKKQGWDMSKLNLADSDFSGLKNLHEKLSSANIQRCLFIGSEMSELFLNNNNVDSCDFSDSNISNSRIQSSMLRNNTFKNCSLKETEFTKSYINECDFSEADFTKAILKSGYFTKNAIANARLSGTSFSDMGIQDIVFEGRLEDCCFENCAFYDVKFQNATLINTFFKNNKKFKRVRFVDCKADKLTYAFLKNNQAELTGVILLN